jgi:hypothetical protein
MADVLLPATSGRAKCRGCGRAIASGELRFGESLPNAYGEGDAMYWFHVPCAACMRPEKVLPVLEASDADVPDRPWLKAAAEFGIAHPRIVRLAYAERSKSGKAKCRSCREAIEGGVMRFALAFFEEGRMSPGGFIHVECTQNYFDTTEVLDRVERLSPGIDRAALDEIAERLKHQREPKSEEPETASDDAAQAGPDLAKTYPDEATQKRAGQS